MPVFSCLLQFKWKHNAMLAIEEPELRNAGHKIAAKIPGVMATLVHERVPGVLAVPELFHTIERVRQGPP